MAKYETGEDIMALDRSLAPFREEAIKRMLGQQPTKLEKVKSHKRDKSRNTPEFNKMAKERRAKAKKNAVARKKNRKK